VAGSSPAIALTWTTTAEGEAARPARPLAIPQPAKAFSGKALAPLRHGVDRHSQPPGDPGVLLPSAAASTILARTTSRCSAVGLRTLASSICRWLAVSETANGLGRLTSG
jgi:hypothetical protein